MKPFNALLKDLTSEFLVEKYSQDDVLQMFRDVHGDKYDYSKVNYIHNKTPVTIICPKHALEFQQKPVHHIHYACGCPECAKEATRASTVSDRETFITSAIEVHGEDAHSYEKVNYVSSRLPVEIICNTCGNTFKQTPNKHLMGCSCPVCQESSGESAIRAWLSDHNIPFEAQYTFDDCKHKRPLPFDFYVPTMNTCIEYDGKQHFKPQGYYDAEEADVKLKLVQFCDSIKNEYCKKNNITVIRIPYTDDVSEYLTSNFKF